MNKNVKGALAVVFHVHASDEYFDELLAIYQVSEGSSDRARIVSVRDRRFFIKISEFDSVFEKHAFLLSVVRERNTWQVKASRNGEISGLIGNQGIVGDPYYYVVIPDDRVVIGFTTGSNASLRSVATVVLEQFNSTRSRKIKVVHVDDGCGSVNIESLYAYSVFRFRVSVSLFDSLDVHAPQGLREIKMPYGVNGETNITFSFLGGGDTSLSIGDVVDTVRYLQGRKECSLLILHGESPDGSDVQVSISRRYKAYQGSLRLRDLYVDEGVARRFLNEAITRLFLSAATS